MHLEEKPLCSSEKLKFVTVRSEKEGERKGKLINWTRLGGKETADTHLKGKVQV